jgi:hypothetical protein
MAVLFLLGLFQGFELGFGEHPAGIGHHLLKSGQALIKGLHAMPQPHATHTAGRDEDAIQAQSVAYPLLTQAGIIKGKVQHCFLHLFGHPVLEAGLAAAFFGQSLNATFLIGLLDPLESVTAVAHQPAGFRYVVQVRSQI